MAALKHAVDKKNIALGKQIVVPFEKTNGNKNWVDLILILLESQKFSINDRVNSPSGLEKWKIGIENPKIALKTLLSPTAPVNTRGPFKGKLGAH